MRARQILPLVGLATFIVMAVLIVRALRQYDLQDVLAALRRITADRFLRAVLLSAASYLALSGVDVIALKCLRRELPYRKVLLASFTSIAIGHTVGFAALSSGAIRYRYYAAWGLRAADVAQLLGFCGVTVVLGLLTAGGILALLLAPQAAALVAASPAAVRLAALLALALPLGYFLLCLWRRRPLRLRHWYLTLPAPRLAAAQLVLGAGNIALVAGALREALADSTALDYVNVAGLYVASSVATLMTHVPGGLGVLEATFLYAAPGASVVASLIVFRVVYFIIPLALGILLFAGSEIVRHRSRSN